MCISRSPITAGMPSAMAGESTASFSAVIIIAGFAYGIQRGIPLGIDFSGGTILVAKFDQPVSDDQVRQALAGVGGEQVIQAYGDPSANQKLIRRR